MEILRKICQTLLTVDTQPSYSSGLLIAAAQHEGFLHTYFSIRPTLYLLPGKWLWVMQPNDSREGLWRRKP